MTPGALSETIARIHAALAEETAALPGQTLAYGRPHAHPRVRYEPRYSRTGERTPGSTRIPPDCPRPVRGRCECPPDGSWRPAVGVVRGDATAHHAAAVPAGRLRGEWPRDVVWVDAVYDQGPDGLWRCRWPMRRAFERMRGQSVRRWSVAVRLLRGDHPSAAWGAHGTPPSAIGEAVRLLAQLERWAAEERAAEYEYRPRQWWDPPKRPRHPNGRALPPSEAQSIAEAADRDSGLTDESSEATVRGETDAADPAPHRTPVSDAVRSVGRPARSGPRTTRATASPALPVPEA